MSCRCNNIQSSKKMHPMVRSEFDEEQIQKYCPECLIEKFSNCNNYNWYDSCISIPQQRSAFDLEMQKKWCPECKFNC